MKKELFLGIANYRYGFGGHFHYLQTGLIPDRLQFSDINRDECQEFFNYVEQSYNCLEEARFRLEDHLADGTIRLQICLHLEDSITLCNSSHNDIVLLYDKNSKEKTLNDLRKKLFELKPQKKTCQSIGIIRGEGARLGVKTFEYSLPKQSVIDYLDNETRDFHQSIVNQLRAQDGAGLYLLYGRPGTGKTSFIKDVLSQTDKQALFISPCFTEDLTSPSLISLLMEYPDSILVIEDAETVIMERKADNSSAVSNLLNLTDGFLADFLNLKIICTFNTDLNNIDKALLRDGRLKGMHQFTKIEPQRAQAIAEALGKSINPDKPLTLAEICVSIGTVADYKPNRIGFQKN